MSQHQEVDPSISTLPLSDLTLRDPPVRVRARQSGSIVTFRQQGMSGLVRPLLITLAGVAAMIISLKMQGLTIHLLVFGILTLVTGSITLNRLVSFKQAKLDFAGDKASFSTWESILGYRYTVPLSQVRLHRGQVQLGFAKEEWREGDTAFDCLLLEVGEGGAFIPLILACDPHAVEDYFVQLPTEVRALPCEQGIKRVGCVAFRAI